MENLLLKKIPQQGGLGLSAPEMSKLYEEYRTGHLPIVPIWELWGIFGCENLIMRISGLGAKRLRPKPAAGSRPSPRCLAVSEYPPGSPA